MADNVAITAGTGTTIATDDIAGVQYQRVKVTWGTDGTANDADTASGKPMPVQVRNSTGTEMGTSAAPWQVSLANHGTNATAVLTTGTGGTFPATQSGTWTVQPGNTANTTPWLITGSGTAGTAAAGVQTIQGIASMTPVQVSQATAANLNAAVVGTGTAGSAAGGVLTVQGVASMTKLMVTPDLPSGASTAANQTSVIGTVAAGTAASNSMMTGGVYRSAGVTLTDGQQAAIALTAQGAHLTAITQIGATNVSVGNGIVTNGSMRVTLASDGTGVLKLWDGTNTAAVKAASTAPTASDPALVVAISPNGVNANGQAAMASSAPVTIASNQTWPTGMSPRAFSAAFTTLTRPANTTAYTAADSISDNATAGSVTALSATVSDTNDDPITITEIHINSTDTGLAGKKLRAYLFNSDPTASTGVGGGDNAAYSQKKAGYIGSFQGYLETGFSDGTVGRLVPTFNETNYSAAGSFVVAKPTSGAKTLYIQFQAVEAFTPSANSTTIIATAKGFQGRAA